jgi:DNA/RNA-binding domain of Phe-tRNA-synthetase-like protein
LTSGGAASPRPGAIDPALAEELPGLRLAWLAQAGRRGPSGDAVAGRLRLLSDRARGATVVAMRTHPIPRAYRTFYRQIGLDPDVERIPAEAAATARLLQGGFVAGDVIDDACLIAVVETGVPVWALDAAAVDERAPGLGIAVAGEGDALAPGSLCVADAGRVHAPLFGEPLAGSAPGARTTRVALYAVGVPGVPDIGVEEALWLAAEVLDGGGER